MKIIKNPLFGSGTKNQVSSIYDAIEKPEPPKAKRSNGASTQPIRSRTSTLGTPVVHSSKPIERITEHLSNMGI